MAARMPGEQTRTTGFVLAKQPSGADAFELLTFFSVESGLLRCLCRSARNKTGSTPAIDLFDEAELWLESSNQGRTWFIKEHRLIQRQEGIGRSYDALRVAAALTTLISRNMVSDESRESIVGWLRTTLAALASGGRSDIIWLKALYCFLRDEGYPVKQQWWPSLTPADREIAAQLLNQPLAAQTAAIPAVVRITGQLEKWTQAETEIRLG
jgi:recombinational DNA repair protein (RecF pathway)